MEVTKHQKILEAKRQHEVLKKNSTWYSKEEHLDVLDLARAMNTSGGGIFSSIPIMCKAEQCPYAASCELQKMDIAPYGQKCPVEIAALEDLFSRYCMDMNVNPQDPEQQVDAIMIKEVVDLDISMLRCDKKFAMSADYIIENVVGITEDHQPILQESITPIADYKERLRNQKYKTLSLLNSTRKDKKGSTITVNTSPIERANALVAAKGEINSTNDDQKERERYEKRMKEIEEKTGRAMNREENKKAVDAEIVPESD